MVEKKRVRFINKSVSNKNIVADSSTDKNNAAY